MAGRDLAEFTGSGFDGGHPLDLQPLHPDYAGGWLHRCQRPGRPGGAFYIEAGNMQAVGGKGQAGDSPVQMGEPPGEALGAPGAAR